MPKCKWCGQSFVLSEAEDEFESEHSLLSYKNIKKCLCGTCANEAIDNNEEGVYFETCEKCGKTFDLIVDKMAYSNHFPWYNGTNLYDEWDEQILCAECAIEKAEDNANDDCSEDDDHNVDDDDSGDEGCVACGNPDYPDCKSSCPLFDD